ncbi:MAG: TraI domain-containing protein [Betaproteobacteria bacterium]|nr:TraI domain-containing protein [Betaproteobacteria bacterium]
MPAKTDTPHRQFDNQGILALPSDTLLGAHQDLIDRIKLCFGMDRTSFDQSIMPLLRRFALTVHLLPCTANNFFSVPGGLLRIGLETAFYALQGTDAHIFSGRSTISERTHLEPRWQRATFIAGLCCELHRLFGQFIVTDAAGKEWMPYLAPLSHWLQQHTIERYYLKWQPNAHEHRALGLFAVPFVVTTDDLQDLAANHSQIVPHMLAAIAGIPTLRGHNVLESLVRRALALVIDRDLHSAVERHGKPQSGAHLERYLIDVLRYLAASLPSWRPNTEKSRLWFGEDGMYLVWPNAFEDVCKQLEADELSGIPKNPKALLEILLASELLVLQEQGSALWRIYPSAGAASLDAVKLTSAGILYANINDFPEPIPVSLLKPSATSQQISGRRQPTDPCADQRGSAASPTVKGKTEHHDEVVTSTVFPFHGEITQKPEQLSLLNDVRTNSSSQNEQVSSTDASLRVSLPSEAPSRKKLVLTAPLRLPLAIRKALQDILSTLDAGSDPEVSWMDDGLFVPFAALKSRKVDAPAALRALNETAMLAVSTPVTGSFRGKEASGVLIALHYIQAISPEEPPRC